MDDTTSAAVVGDKTEHPTGDHPPPAAVDVRDTPEGRADPHDHARPSLLARPLLALIRGYQTVRAGRPSPCRYWPSCSTYAVEALEVHGAVKGLGLAVWRVARCNPFGGHGVDPVPEKKARRV